MLHSFHMNEMHIIPGTLTISALSAFSHLFLRYPAQMIMHQIGIVSSDAIVVHTIHLDANL